MIIFYYYTAALKNRKQFKQASSNRQGSLSNFKFMQVQLAIKRMLKPGI